MKNIVDFAGLQIKLASPEEILSWSHGEVLKPETINYRTQKPEKDGLFCERIFGPTKDWECYCGKYKRVRFRGIICDKCGVEVTQSRVRRERMAHIKLATPIAHVWFFKGAPSKISLLLDISPKKLTSVIYFSKYLVLSVDEKAKEEAIKKIAAEKGKKVEIIRSDFDDRTEKLKDEAKEQLVKLKKTVKDKDELAQKTENVKLALKQRIAALREQMVGEITLQEEIGAKLGDLINNVQANSLLSESEYIKFEDYGVVDWLTVGMGAEALIESLKKIDLDALAGVLREEIKSNSETKRLKAIKRLQVVRGLKNSAIRPEWMILSVLPVIPPDLRPMVQLSGGRYAASDLNDLYRRVINRNNRLRHLIGLGAPEIILRNEKRMLQEAVDALIDSSQAKTTRRSRVGKTLKSISDLLKGKQGRFRQNLLGKRVDYSGRELILKGLAPNVKSAKNIIEKRPPEVFDILEEITREHPVLLNRAPTLHKLSIQAFWPVLVEGSAIRLHPVVCEGFNADFDGDQMAVHVPLTEKAKKEAVKYMFPRNNLLKPSSGNPINIPVKKEMGIGIYLITSLDVTVPAFTSPLSGREEAITAYQNGRLKLRQGIKLRLNPDDTALTDSTVGCILFNQILPEGWQFINESMPSRSLSNLFEKAIKELEEGNKKAKEIEDNYRLGLITNEERKKLAIDMWMQTTEELAEKTWATFSLDNPIRTIIDTGGGRINKNTIKQLSAMRGIGVDPLGNFVELPTKSNYREGLTIFEYVTAIRGSRKGLTDTALRTADAGYLTRRLVDVSHDCIVRSLDCGNTEGLEIFSAGQRPNQFAGRIVTRNAAKKVIDPESRKVIVNEGEIITDEKSKQIKEAKVESVFVYSPLTCKLRFGICAKCYGMNYATNAMAKVGDPVGIIAAQSIGEPGTQLTMRTKHAGGIAGLDVTQGLPRVTELFEVRSPKIAAPITEVSGKVKIMETDNGNLVTVTPTGSSKDERKEYLVPLTLSLQVEDGDLVAAGTQLASGSVDVKNLLKIKGLRASQEYLIKEIQGVYESQGISIHDKHFEAIVRQMSDKVRIDEPGDTQLLSGDIISRGTYELANEAVIAQGGNPATATHIILGTIRSSLYTDSWLSAASFQDTTSVLTDASVQGRVDHLIGMKENVIIGRLIPTSKSRAAIENLW
ncbi:MAG: DNA-directed RNA polymerase subunit beta' [Microgenomates group bacterium GW2011_GWC1_47_20]|nr:MAG: DNA-directed RNA polymerase subunit beta' [Microgenomates group bacterium GW2011_GWC1_47_20]